MSLWNKYFLTEVYRNIQRIDFLGHIEMVQCNCFSWHQPKMFLPVLQECIFFIMLSELNFTKSVRFIERNCIVKWMILFASFCWFGDFLQGQSENNWYEVFNMRYLIIHFLVQFFFFFFRTVLQHFSKYNLKTFHIVCQPWWPIFYSVPTATIKKLPMALNVHIAFWFCWS